MVSHGLSIFDSSPQSACCVYDSFLNFVFIPRKGRLKKKKQQNYQSGQSGTIVDF